MWKCLRQPDSTGLSEDISSVPRCTLVPSLHLLPDSELSTAENTGFCSPKRGLEEALSWPGLQFTEGIK